MRKIMLVSSAGGHFNELNRLKLETANVTKIVEKTPATTGMADHYLVYGTRANKLKYPFIFGINCFLSLYYILRYRPDVIISTGAHSCVSFFYLAHFLGIKTIYIESYAKVKSESLTLKLIKKKASKIFVQHQELAALDDKYEYIGEVY